MAQTQPIRNTEEIEQLKNYYLKDNPNMRNYALITTDLNTALRISDILKLKWENIYDSNSGTFLKHIKITETKTEKWICIAINENLKDALTRLRSSYKRPPKPTDYIFTGRHSKSPLSRSQAFRIIKKACYDLSLSIEISPHSLRKTFGYKAWSEGVSPVIIMAIYNHSSFSITKRYLGIEQDDKDEVYLNINI